MTFCAAAIDRIDVANYVDALFGVYLIMIFARIVVGWVQQFRPIPYWTPLRAVISFLEETVDPLLNLFRGFIPPIRAGGMGLDLSPILAILALAITRTIVVNLIAG